MTFFKYLRYRLRLSAVRNVTLSLLAACALILEAARENPYSQIGNELMQYKSHTDLYHTATITFLFAVACAVLETAPFKNRRELDLLYSMPIERRRLILAHYLSGLIQVFFSASLPFFGYWLYMGIHTDYYSLSWLALYYPLMLAVGAAMYSVTILVFNEANTLVDGAVFTALWITAPSMYAQAVLYNLDRYIPDAHMRVYNEVIENSCLYSPAQELAEIFRILVETNRGKSDVLLPAKHLGAVRCVAIWIAVGIACALIYFYKSARSGAEKAGEISSSWFGYKVLIPLCGISAIAVYKYSDMLPVFILMGMFLGYVLYRRTLKLRLPDWIMIGIAALVPLSI